MVLSFQSTLPREERQSTALLPSTSMSFQSTLPREERLSNNPYIDKISNFNPRSHERSDIKIFVILLLQVSDFNPRSHERSDIASRLSLSDARNFNPRSHERSDEYAHSKTFGDVIISIHAPTRGATDIEYSNGIIVEFQSTLPREERRLWWWCFWWHSNFNPRSHERSDKFSSKILIIQWISIHAPTRGATYYTLCISNDKAISIHAPTRGATEADLSLFLNLEISIHAPTRGATAILHKKFVYFYTIPTINI